MSTSTSATRKRRLLGPTLALVVGGVASYGAVASLASGSESNETSSAGQGIDAYVDGSRVETAALPAVATVSVASPTWGAPPYGFSTCLAETFDAGNRVFCDVDHAVISNGLSETDLELSRWLSVTGGEVDCAEAPGRCWIFVSSLELENEWGAVSLQFDPTTRREFSPADEDVSELAFEAAPTISLRDSDLGIVGAGSGLDVERPAVAMLCSELASNATGLAECDFENAGTVDVSQDGSFTFDVNLSRPELHEDSVCSLEENSCHLVIGNLGWPLTGSRFEIDEGGLRLASVP